MNKQILRKISLIFFPLIIIGVASYFLIASNVKEVKAIVSPSGVGSAFDLFKGYEAWPNSTTQKTGTAAEWLHTMSTAGPTTPTTASTFADVNGDGLGDILVHYEFVAGSAGSYHYFYYGVLLNRGDLKFDSVYKCVYVAGSPDKFYGDCAAL